MTRLSRPLAAWLLLAVLLSMAPPPAAGQGAPIVRKISFTGLHALAEETIRFYLQLETAEGQPLDSGRLNERIHYLWSRNLIDDIRVETVPAEGGVELRIAVTERPILRVLEYEGLKRVSRSDIDERLDKERITVREGLPLDRGELQRLETAIEDLYREKGYRFVDVVQRLEEISPAETKVAFTVDEGDRVRIADIEFEGNTVFDDRRLRWTMKKTKESALISRISKHDIYNPASLDEDLDLVREIYKEQGYKNVFLGEPEIEVRALDPEAKNEDDQKRRLFITVPIEEGERWRIGQITLEGNDVYSDELLRNFFARSLRGGWLRATLLRESVEAVEKLYKNNGYILAQINSELVEREDNVADVVVNVAENDQFRVGRLEFEGNTRTLDKVLRREMRVQEGTVLNMGALQDSLYKIRQLNYFELNEDDPILFEPDYEKKVVDLVVQGQEADRTELQIGGGWSEVDGFFGQFSMQTRNFMGRGETLGLSYQTGRYRDMFDVSYFVPWFLDKPQSVGVQIFRRDEDYDLLTSQRYLQKSAGGTISYGRSFGLFQNAGVSYTNQSIEDRRTFIPEEGEPLVQDYSREVSSIRPVWSYDSRNNRLTPTMGTRISTSVEYAGDLLGGNSNFVRPEAGASWFKPVSGYPVRTVLGINFETGWVEPLAGAELNPFETYFLGGDNSVRGFQYRSLWVRCEGGEIIPTGVTGTRVCLPNETLPDIYGFPQGGNKFFQINFEYQFLFGEAFRFVLWADAGNVFGQEQSLDFSRLRYTAGSELRIFVPMLGAPLRFIYSFNLDPLPDDRFESFDFSIGTSF